MDITRREAFITALLPLLQPACITRLQAEPAQAADNNTVFDHDLPDITMDGWHVNASVITFPPGRVGTPHQHPGFVLVYVLEGTSSQKFLARKNGRIPPDKCFTNSRAARTKSAGTRV
jgi:hypothetical protein